MLPLLLNLSAEPPEETVAEPYFDVEADEKSVISKLDRAIYAFKMRLALGFVREAVILLLLGFGIITMWGTYRIPKPSQVDKPVFEEVATSSAVEQYEAPAPLPSSRNVEKRGSTGACSRAGGRII